MSGRDTLDATRITLRPIGNPLPLGFLALTVATVGFSALQLGWIAPTEARVIAISALLFTAPLQLLASVYGFLARDPVAGTGMGILAGTWAIVGYVTFTSTPGSTSGGLGVVLLTCSAAMLVPVSAAVGKLVAALVMTLASVRFAVTGIYELTESQMWEDAAGLLGLLLAAVALYAAAGFEVEDARRRTILPLWRRGAGAQALQGDLAAQAAGVEHEAGVREQL